MKTLKLILKIALGLAAGFAVGLLISGVLAVLLTDSSFSDFILKLGSLDISEGIMAVVVAVAALFVSLFLLITFHELGHLVCGLMSGYRFVSFRILDFTFIRIGGRLRIKRFAVAGTGGQCLMCPPDRPVAEIPFTLYNLGGIIANVILLVPAIVALIVTGNPFVSESATIFLLCDVFLILTNGIPLKAGGIGNDAYNLLLLRRSMLSRRGMILQLRSNALIQEGVRPRDMPAEWFSVPADIDFSNALEVSIPLMQASRTLDMMLPEQAYEELSSIYRHKDTIIPIYVNETACELIFTALVTGRLDEAITLLTDDLAKYIRTYGKVLSSKQRLLSAIALFIENDCNKAEEIYHKLERDRAKYLLQGEVKSDLDIMHRMLFPD